MSRKSSNVPLAFGDEKGIRFAGASRSGSAEDTEVHTLLPPTPTSPPEGKLGAFAVAIVLFASVAGGPFGIEPAVGAAGALPVLLGSIALAFMWSAPQALVAAELSTAFPSNGGYVTWVVKGLGPTLGFVNAANSLVSALCNLPLYPSLFSSYLQQLFPDMTSGALFAVRLASLILTLGLNAVGIEAVTTTNTIFTVIVLTPFIVMPIAALGYRQSFDWSGLASVTPNWQGNFSVFVATLYWNALGWVNIGNVASDVRNPRRSYPIGAGMAVLGVALIYLYSVSICAALAPDPTQWTVGYFVNIGSNIAPWVGVWTTIAAAFSCMNNFQPQLATTARALRFVALYRMIPLKWLGRNWQRYHTPLPALLVQGVVVGVLMNVGFDVLVIINVLFYNVGLLLQFAAFLRLRYTEPDLPRPYLVPGGMIGAWILVLVFYVVLGVAFYAAGDTAAWSLYSLIGANVVFVVLGWLWTKYIYEEGSLDAVDAAEEAHKAVHTASRGSVDENEHYKSIDLPRHTSGILIPVRLVAEE